MKSKLGASEGYSGEGPDIAGNCAAYSIPHQTGDRGKRRDLQSPEGVEAAGL